MKKKRFKIHQNALFLSIFLKKIYKKVMLC
ncbi:MAG: hypothetical protein RL757_201 [Bacteroidota bacterium]|jgi:hypothetical protein